MIKNMEIIKVLVGWEDKNYSAVAECNGVVVATHKDFEMLKKEFTEAFAFHINESAKDGDPISPALLNGDYTLEYELQTSALLHIFDGVLTRAALSKVTGINERQLGHYAQGIRTPRPQQREKIVQGIHQSGRQFLSVC